MLTKNAFYWYFNAWATQVGITAAVVM